MGKPDDERLTHFGYRQVATEEKAELVSSVFESVASRYDVMNDVMSAGIHRVWKRFTVTAVGAREGERIMDLAGGTGDLAALMAPQVGPTGQVVVVDRNAAMLFTGRDRLLDKGQIEPLAYAIGDAEALTFPENCFDCVTMAFGLRNVTPQGQGPRRDFSRLATRGAVVRARILQARTPGAAAGL